MLEVRRIQKDILRDYEEDFSKHIPTAELAKVTAIWNSIPSQLAKENKKFIWGALKKGARAKEFENAVQWLTDAYLVHKVPRVKKIGLPVKFYEDFSAFKLFFNDIGFPGILVSTKLMTEYKGAFTEQYVAQQYFSALSSKYTLPLYYYLNENSTLEIDFVFQKKMYFRLK